MKKTKKAPKTPEFAGQYDFDSVSLTRDLSRNTELLNSFFEGDETFIVREAVNRFNPALSYCLYFSDGMVSTGIINDNLLRPLINTDLSGLAPSDDAVCANILQGNDTKKTGDLKDIIEAIVGGDTFVMVNGQDSGVVVNTKSFNVRSIAEPEDEKSLRGPREGFSELIMTNISLIRRKLKTCDLKFAFQTLGTRSNTRVCVCYLDSLIDKKVLKTLEERLSKIEIDGILDSNYIAEYIRDRPFSIFKTIGTSEKPDVVAARLLEGRIALLVDGSPIILTVPYLFVENFQSPDDYYLNFYFATIGRALRCISFFITISVPALYIALVAYHQEMIPTTLLMSISMAAKGVPMPAIVECTGMLVVFELLRETGVRMPNKTGQALSIVGALVVGQAAVEARIVSAPMVIVVAVTGITGLMMPRINAASIILRMITLLSSAFFGLYGYYFAMIAFAIALLSMRSFDVDYTSQMFSFRFKDSKDTYIRAPMFLMKARPHFLSKNKTRTGGTPS